MSASNSPQDFTLLFNEGYSSNHGNITRSDKFWFKDGTVILQAENIQFCIHGGFLGLGSAFFRDLFAGIRPVGMHWGEGCHVFRLDDDAKDWVNFLGMLYQIDGSPENYPISRVTSIIKISQKYEFEDDKFLKTLLEKMREKGDTGNHY